MANQGTPPSRNNSAVVDIDANAGDGVIRIDVSAPLTSTIDILITPVPNGQPVYSATGLQGNLQGGLTSTTNLPAGTYQVRVVVHPPSGPDVVYEGDLTVLKSVKHDKVPK